MRTWDHRATSQQLVSVRLERFALIVVLVGVAFVSGASPATAQEGLPPLPPDPARAETQTPNAPADNDRDKQACPQIVDRPLSELTVDIYPRDLEGVVVQTKDRPQDCWGSSGRQFGAIFISGGDGSCGFGCGWNCHDLLQLARFKHPPLYFEDAGLERYGEVATCPATRATARFACDLLLLPAKMLIQRPCSCVCTPTPHCCSPHACGCH